MVLFTLPLILTSADVSIPGFSYLELSFKSLILFRGTEHKVYHQGPSQWYVSWNTTTDAEKRKKKKIGRLMNIYNDLYPLN